jgi:hypothetical protein
MEEMKIKNRFWVGGMGGEGAREGGKEEKPRAPSSMGGGGGREGGGERWGGGRPASAML